MNGCPIYHPIGADAHIRPLPGLHPPPSRAQADLVEQAFRQQPRNFYQTNNRGARPAQLSESARAGRRLPCLSQHAFRNLSSLSKPARTRRFCAKRFFLLDRPRPVLFLSRTKREWGVECRGDAPHFPAPQSGALTSHHHGCNLPGGHRSPLRPVPADENHETLTIGR